MNTCPALATALYGTIRNQNADRNREVEGRPYLRKVGGGEIHYHASLRIGATDAVIADRTLWGSRGSRYPVDPR